jgi:hypothetical protein
MNETSVLTADLRCPLSPGRDVVHCASMALAWHELVARFGPLRFDGQPPLADALNEPLDATAVDPAMCVAHAGFGGEGILDRITANLAARFPDAPTELLPAQVAADALLAFAYLARALPFRTAFESLVGTFAGRRVGAFGVQGGGPKAREQRAQAVVHDYVSAADFVLELRPEDAEDRILVAQVPRPATLRAAIEQVVARLDRLQGESAAVVDREALSVPCLAIDAAAKFPELVGRPLLNEGAAAARFDEARQVVHFSLDHRGARVSSEAVIHSFGPPPRSFCVTEPFLVLLLRRASRTPYLAAWLETATWMQDRGEAPKASGGFFAPPPG